MDTLRSVQDQVFRDFELIIVDNKSTDTTCSEINEFFDSEYYKKNPFKHVFIINKKHLDGVKNWNEPLRLAQGRYIAMLEGDDQFRPGHLKTAYRVLSQDGSIGIYAVDDSRGKIFGIGKITPNDYVNYIYTLQGVSTPSQTIFIAKNEERYLFNTCFVYAPEVELFFRIAMDGYYAYHNPIETVIRGVPNRTEMDVLVGNVNAFADRLTLLSMFKAERDMSEKQYLGSLNKQLFNILYNFAPKYKLFKKDRWQLFRILFICLKFFLFYAWQRNKQEEKHV